MIYQVGAIIAAGGSSSRMGGIDKLFRLIDGVPVIIMSIMAFSKNKNISSIVVSIKDESKPKLVDLLNEYNLYDRVIIVSGGETRQQSVINALKELSNCDFVAVHDAARPFVSQSLIDNCIYSAFEFGSAVPVLPSTDTLKSVDNNRVIKTVDRDTIYRVQTPQVFRFNDYLDAIKSISIQSATDDSMIMEEYGVTVNTCVGDANNIKLTYSNDFEFADYLVKGNNMFRTGIGYDVHRLVEGRKLILCGVEIPYKTGLLGHSDADVAVHALMDAILGAAALGDIGKLFPDTDDEFKDADSVELLKVVVDTVNKKGYTISNVDITIIAQKPKLSQYVIQMREIIANACNCPVDHVNIKATTEEGLGFTGAELGISSLATCSLFK